MIHYELPIIRYYKILVASLHHDCVVKVFKDTATIQTLKPYRVHDCQCNRRFKIHFWTIISQNLTCLSSQCNNRVASSHIIRVIKEFKVRNLYYTHIKSAKVQYVSCFKRSYGFVPCYHITVTASTMSKIKIETAFFHYAFHL